MGDFYNFSELIVKLQLNLKMYHFFFKYKNGKKDFLSPWIWQENG